MQPLTYLDKDENVIACPICGGELQATAKLYVTGVVLSADGLDVVDRVDDSELGEDWEIYCSNHHTHEDILKALKELSLATEET